MIKKDNNRLSPLPSDEQDIRPDNAPTGTETTGHHRYEHRKKYTARQRGARSMGRFPFLTAISKYIERWKHKKAGTTLIQEERTLKRIHEHFQELYKQGKVSTTNPSKMNKDDVRAYVYWLKTRPKPLNINTQTKYCQYLTNLLVSCNNASATILKSEKELPRAQHDSEIEVLTESEVAHIIDCAKKMDGWQGTVLSFVVEFAVYTGLRPGEHRRAEFVDLDTKKWTFFVRHPKGEGSWGRKVHIPIAPHLRKPTLDYLEKRKKRLEELGIQNCTALIPNLHFKKGMGEEYTEQSYGNIRRDLEEASGIAFDFRILRRCAGQFLRDRGVPIDVISKILRHRTTRTTETYYARIRDTQAYGEVEAAWSSRPLASQGGEELGSLIEN